MTFLTDEDIDCVSNINELASGIRNYKSFEGIILPAIRKYFGLSVSTLSSRPGEKVHVPDHVVFCGGQPDATQSYNHHYRHLVNHYRYRMFSSRAAKDRHVIDMQDVFEENLMHRTVVYREFQRPMGMDRSMAMIISATQNCRVMLGLWRDREAQAFGEADMAKARMLAPTLSGAFSRVQDNEQHIRFTWLFELLDPVALTAPILLLDSNYTVTFANSAAHNIVGRHCRSGQHNNFTDPLKRSLVALCDASSGTNGAKDRIRIDEEDWSVNVTPIPDNFGSGFVLHFGNGDITGDPVRNLRDQGLTARELEVVRSAARGLSSKEVARELGISYFTVQDHMKSIYRKLNVKSRVGLANLLHTRS